MTAPAWQSVFAGIVGVAAIGALCGGTFHLDGDAERARICKPGFSKTIRPPLSVTEPIKLRMLREMGIPARDVHLTRLDHVCPLELDCPPLDLRNLQIQDIGTAEAKDILERKARKDYCDGRITLEEARDRFHRDDGKPWRSTHNQERGSR